MTTTNLASFRAGMLMCASLISLLAESTAGAEREPRTAEYGRIPLHFEANRGQADHSIDYVARGPGYALSLQAKQASLQLRSGENSSLLRMRVVGANAAAEPQGAEELEGKVNYFIGSDPAHWRQDVPTYGRVRYRHVYRGIDLVYYGNQRQLEYDFIVAPGADWRRIQLLFEGADNLEIEAATGDLLLHVGDGIVRQAKPTVYQEINGERRPVEGSYRLRQGNRVGFAIGEYDRNLPLIIDPVLVYSTYLGGSGTDDGNDIKVDSAGNAYICGNTSSTNFPTANAIQATFGGATFAGGRDAFVTKINADGTGFVYSTYLGGSGDDRANKIAVDSAGNAYVAGETTSSSNFPRVNALQSNFGGGLSDAFITKLNADGSAIVYSTYLGGSVFDAASGIAIDSSRNAYITGRTTSANFPTANAIQATQASANADAFVTKINAEGSALVYSTYLGGSGGEAFDAGFSIAVDSVGAAYVTGQTTSTGFPTVNPVQANFGGGSPDGDAFVTKINADGMSLAYSTYLGGGANDVGFEITVDSAGSAYVAGVARSANFPTANAYQAMLNGASDAFVTKFAPAGSALAYSTYFGGSSEDSGNGIVANSDGEVYLAGGTSSADLPTANPTQAMTGGGIDGFVTHFNADGSALVYSSYLGGSGADTILAIALDTDLGMYVTGRTASSDFQTLSPIQTSNGGGQDAFVAKLSVDPPPTPTPTPTPIVTPTPNPTPSATPTPTPVPPQLLNISTRLRVGTGANALFGGFIITGSDSKRVIIRAIGPSLAEQGVAGVLEDPTLELFDGAGESIAFNDNWKDDQQADIEGSTIAPNDDLEAAIVRTLQPGNYTAIVRGSGDTTGIGLVEIYDLAAGTQTKLANISSRGFVEIGENVLIGGFIVRGESGTTRVVLRAIGPSLGEQGVEGALQDPALQLVDENGSEIAVNDDWKSGSQQAELEALHIAPANDLEAALIATLGNGNYTAIVSGRSDSTGVGLVEVYNVP